jgi:hypothetical protein
VVIGNNPVPIKFLQYFTFHTNTTHILQFQNRGDLQIYSKVKGDDGGMLIPPTSSTKIKFDQI